MTQYRAFYPAVEPSLVLNAQAKTFPLRSTPHEAAQDARDRWHKEGEHIVVYQIGEDNTVTEMQSRVKREVRVWL